MKLDVVPTPALLLDVAVLDRNLSRMQSRADRLGVHLRPHVKTHKCVEIAERQRALGARGLTVSTIAEARVFADAGFDDLTWAVPNPLSRIPEILALARRVTLRLLVDDARAIDALDAAAQSAGLVLHTWLEVDSGDHRTGVDPEDPRALDLIARIRAARGLVLDGLLTHGGHAYGARTPEELRRIAREERDVLLELKERARRAGLDAGMTSLGSTPSISVAESLEGIDEIRPGNYVFHDRTQASLGSCALEACAVTVLASVISHRPPSGSPGARGVAGSGDPSPYFVTDAGALAMSKDPGPAEACALGPSGYGLIFEDLAARRLEPALALATLSQEHGIIRGPAEVLAGRFEVGSRVRILENHSCLTAAAFDAYTLVSGLDVLGSWTIHRAR